MKVEYTTAAGWRSTAYLDDAWVPGSATATGEDKHSGEPLALVWTESGWVAQRSGGQDG